MTLKHVKPKPDLIEIRHDQLDLIVQGHRLLKQTMESGYVENLESFLKTVSPCTDTFVKPHVIGAFHKGVLIGLVVGSYLVKADVGFVSYAAVDSKWRQNKVYSNLRKTLISTFQYDADNQPDSRLSYVASEMIRNSLLFKSITSHDDMFVLPCDYEQPATQGLLSKQLEFLVQSISGKIPHNLNEILCILKEVYRGIYRIPDYESNITFKKLRASLLIYNLSALLTIKPGLIVKS